MNRKKRCEEVMEVLFGPEGLPTHPGDAGFTQMVRGFTFGDIYRRGGLSRQHRLLITLVALTVSHTLNELGDYARAAVRVGVSDEAVREALYQCAPYVGYPKVLEALEQVNRALGEVSRGPGSAPVAEDERFSAGLQTRASIFGQETYQTMEQASGTMRDIQRYLCAYCFGDFYTRPALDVQTRELLTLCMLTMLGGCEAPLRAHIKANLAVGNGVQQMEEATISCLPFVGFPRVLNAMACIQKTAGGSLN